jgi:molybdopterin molybdotransferase
LKNLYAKFLLMCKEVLMKPVQPLIEIEAAKARIRSHFGERPIKTEEVRLFDALGRYLAVDLQADQDMPPFDKATVDGYAVSTRTLLQTIRDMGAKVPGIKPEPALRLLGEVMMGSEAQMSPSAAREGCVYIPTGGCLPPGFDAVIKIEETRQEGDVVYFKNVFSEGVSDFVLQPGQNIIRRGEDVRAGDKLIKKGRRLTRYDLGVLGMLGFKDLEVIIPPRLSIATTGDELIDIDAPLSPGKIRDINGTVLSGIARDWGLGPVRLTRLEDTYEAVENYIREEINSCDLLITSGGSSVGKKDYIPQVVDALSDDGLLFHGMNIKPGKPIGVASVQGKPVVLLPGNPVSTVMGFIVLVGELISRFGFDIQQPFCYAELKEAIGPEDGRTTFHMVRLSEGEGVLKAVPLKGKSGLITYIANADGYVIAPVEGGDVSAGNQVKVYML